MPLHRTRAPLPLNRAKLDQVEIVFTDVDGTLTTDDKIKSATIKSMEQLQKNGVKVVLVSGRPSGWGECWMRQWPVDGVIVENGGLAFVREGHRIMRRYAEPEGVRQANRKRLESLVKQVLQSNPGAQLSSDSASTEVDLAIDHHEDVKLETKQVDALEKQLKHLGITAVRSSVHINCWLGAFDKATAVKKFLQEEFQTSVRRTEKRFLYVGDSLNDAPMFDCMPLSIGVANIAKVLEIIDCTPRFITQQAEGAGFEEVARAILLNRKLRARR
jgi:HAD superfamily hydrolase (TIGR01484 family)